MLLLAVKRNAFVQNFQFSMYSTFKISIEGLFLWTFSYILITRLLCLDILDASEKQKVSCFAFLPCVLCTRPCNGSILLDGRSHHDMALYFLKIEDCFFSKTHSVPSINLPLNVHLVQ